jgi:hypothetical protein
MLDYFHCQSIAKRQTEQDPGKFCGTIKKEPPQKQQHGKKAKMHVFVKIREIEESFIGQCGARQKK